MNKYIILLAFPGVLLIGGWEAVAQSDGINYDESRVPAYELPDPLLFANGTAVRSTGEWGKRRQEILQLFRTYVYGISPAPSPDMKFEVVEQSENALTGKAIRKQIRVYFTGHPSGPSMEILLYLPTKGKRPTPVFIGLNFNGNHTIHTDPAIHISDSWVRNNPKVGVVNHIATEKTRGIAASRWPVQRILERGYGVATIYCGDIDPDFDDRFQNGVHPAFYKPGQTHPKADEWGTIAAWAWGLRRAVDYFETDDDVDHSHLAVLGHSRLGKTSLWAGATDQRFALVISNDSGCGGAALSRRRIGETVRRINTSFPHWFCDNFVQFNDNEDALPVDQHMLIALAAPRPIYVASATKDRWADPRGEFLSALEASRVYDLLGYPGLPVDEMPAPDTPVMGQVGYHIRSGQHDITEYDWNRYMDFADKHGLRP